MGLSWFTTTNGAAFWSLLFPLSPPSDQKWPRPSGPFNRCHSFAISFLSIQVKNKLHCAIFPPTLVGIRSFIRNRCIFVKIWGLKLLKCMSGGGIKSMLAGCVFFPNSPQLIGYGKELCGILDANFNLLSDSESTQVSHVTSESLSLHLVGNDLSLKKAFLHVGSLPLLPGFP